MYALGPQRPQGELGVQASTILRPSCNKLDETSKYTSRLEEVQVQNHLEEGSHLFYETRRIILTLCTRAKNEANRHPVLPWLPRYTTSPIPGQK